MERPNTKITRKEKIQIVFNILLALAIGTLLFTTIVIIRNADEIKADPIMYAIEKSNIESCFCINDQGQSYNYGLNQNQENDFLGNREGIKTGDLQLVKET